MQHWVCSTCGDEIEELEAEPRKPCPKCGSLARTADVLLTESIRANAYLKTHSKHREGGKKVVREVIEGDDYYRKTSKWSVMRRVIDRANNWYEETFRDRASHKVIHHTAERLTDHKKPKKD